MTTAIIHLIETIRVEPGRVMPLLDGHEKRLRASCGATGHAWPGEPLLRALRQHVAGLDALSMHRVRLLLAPDGTYSFESGVLAAAPARVRVRLDEEALQRGNFWLRHKTTNRPWYTAAQAWLARNPAFFDVLFCNELDEVCEGSRSNVYILDDRGVWLTPPMECGLLPGVQRQALLDGGLVREARISRGDLLSAREVRISNALRGWVGAAL